MQQIICRRTMQLIISNLSLFKDLKGLVIMNKDDRKKDLNSTQFHVTQECGTEPPFHNEFWNNKKAGIYVDIVSGEPLFSSLDKFDSGTGWPSFIKPLEDDNIVTKTDIQLWNDPCRGP
jgi:methionine-R-sulfoxide reductase